MNVEPYFSPDYATARRRFREAAATCGWRLDQREGPARGPSGEPLWIDAAVSPSPGDRALVVSSGLHGIEGFFGSAVQLALLDRWRSSTPLRCIFVHALNPYGFAWLRRTEEQNVDLNRNFLLDGEPYAGSPEGYAALDPLLNPRHQPSRLDPFPLTLMPILARRGSSAVREAVAVGQYDFPRGLFFGGADQAPASRAIASALRAWLADAGTVVHLDLHTGLGRRAEGRLLLDYPPTARQRDRLTRWFGAGAFSAPDSASYTARGGLGRWCVSQPLAPEYLFAYAEFGTFGGVRVLGALRAENQAHHWAPQDSRATVAAKTRLKESFCPASPGWRRLALARSVDLAIKAANGLRLE
jgi:Protein of unknown function (DUF2817)